ncbi:MAG: SH3 domain-containing protein [Chloroflexi bacterium]|nr:SH3 domain-containing protein [Chloroflexota bacterium]
MRYALALLLALILALSSLAQNSYMIRLDAEANLRESWSLDSDLVARVPQGTRLNVLKHFNRWLKVSYEGSELWLADWVMHTRLSDDEMLQPDLPPAPAQLMLPPMIHMIRLNTEANLRDQHSLDSDIVGSVPEGTLLTVMEEFNRWFKVMHDGNEGWLAAWVMHTRLTDEEVSDLLMPPPPTIMYVDNCCQLGQECDTDEQWEGGYKDFLAGLCLPPADTDEVIYDYPPIATIMDNCCLLGRSCENEDDWQNGYYDFVRDMCGMSMMMSMSDMSDMSMDSMMMPG